MRKPLLTDEVLERANRKKQSRRFGYYEPEYDERDAVDVPEDFDEDWEDDLEKDWEDTYTGYREGETIRIPVESSIVKSRRIETVKREEFRSKVNKILFWVVLLLILFLIAVFYL